MKYDRSVFSRNTVKLGIFSKALAVILLVSLIPSVGLLISSQNRVRLQRELVNDELEEVNAAIVEKVNHWIQVNQLALEQNAANAAMQTMDPEQQVSMLKSLLGTYEWTYLFHTVDTTGNNVARSDEGTLRDYGDRAYFQQVISGQRLGQQVLIGRTSGKPALCLSVPIARSNVVVGVLTGCSSLAAISRTVVDTRIGATGFAFLVDGQGRAIAHGRPALIARELQDLSDRPALQAQTRDRPIEFRDNGRSILAYGRDTDLGWTLFVQQDLEEALAPAIEARQTSLVVLGITFGATILLGFVFARGLVQPIQALTAVADAVSRGQLDITIADTQRHDEIGALARSVKRLATSVKVAFEQLQQRSH